MKRLIRSSILISLLICASSAFAGHRHLEKEYQAAWCSARGGIQEYRLDDGARVDCLLPEYAIEFDFAAKWAECIGQAAYYGKKMNRQPACVLIVEGGENDAALVERGRFTATVLGVKFWTMDERELK